MEVPYSKLRHLKYMYIMEFSVLLEKSRHYGKYERKGGNELWKYKRNESPGNLNKFSINLFIIKHKPAFVFSK
jgi:hypothetical protein